MNQFIPALALAVFAAILTAFCAFSQQVRPMAILFRASISLVFFVSLGLVFTFWAKRSFKSFFVKSAKLEEDMVLNQASLANAGEESKTDSSFQPLSADKLEHISESKG